MNYRAEFPDCPPETMPAIPATWLDQSWHNDACPCFNTGKGLVVFIDFADTASRECPETKRFTAHSCDENGGPIDVVFETDDWNELLAFLIGLRFSTALKEQLTPAQFAEMKRLNATADYASGCCASHNFCDANMVMAPAFEEIMGRALIAENSDVGMTDADCRIVNAAWDSARHHFIGSPARQTA